MSEIVILQKNIENILEKIKLKYQISSDKEIYHNMLNVYSKMYRKYYLYPEEINFILKHNRHPAKNIKRVKENLELLLLRMERETKSFLS